MMLLPLTWKLQGEVANPARLICLHCHCRSVIVKETELLDKGINLLEPIGTMDIHCMFRNLTVLKKKNEAEFPPIIDLYVEIENAKRGKGCNELGRFFIPFTA
jgi:hypothetical protein